MFRHALKIDKTAYRGEVTWQRRPGGHKGALSRSGSQGLRGRERAFTHVHKDRGEDCLCFCFSFVPSIAVLLATPPQRFRESNCGPEFVAFV